MSASEHTPGPWGDPDKRVLVLLQEALDEIHHPGANPGITDRILDALDALGGVAKKWLGEVNAEMLEALKEVVADVQDYERINNLAAAPGKQDCWQSVTKARAAITKAEGHEP